MTQPFALQPAPQLTPYNTAPPDLLSDMLVTLPVFHDRMWPYIASADVELLDHDVTAVCNDAVSVIITVGAE